MKQCKSEGPTAGSMSVESTDEPRSYDQYALCFRSGLNLATELATCVNDRLNLDPAIQSGATTSGLISTPSGTTGPVIITAAIPFWSNGSIAYLSTTATLPLSAGLRTGPAPLITTTPQFTASGLRTGALPIPPAFSQTGIWTNTTGSFASPTLPARGSAAPSNIVNSQGNRNGTFLTPTYSIFGAGPTTTSSSPSSMGDPYASQLDASGSLTGSAGQSTTGARVESASTSEGQLCSLHTIIVPVH